jgi:hypothetical protein
MVSIGFRRETSAMCRPKAIIVASWLRLDKSYRTLGESFHPTQSPTCAAESAATQLRLRRPRAPPEPSDRASPAGTRPARCPPRSPKHAANTHWVTWILSRGIDLGRRSNWTNHRPVSLMGAPLAGTASNAQKIRAISAPSNYHETYQRQVTLAGSLPAKQRPLRSTTTADLGHVGIGNHAPSSPPETSATVTAHGM